MEFADIIAKAKDIRAAYEKYEKKTYGKTWSEANIAEGFVGDVGDLMKLVLAKQGVRQIENVDEKLAHELSDCLWSIIVLADLYSVDLEESFLKTMNEVEARIDDNG
ncbi:MAG: MazG nucleotide pyrophosphohydrolase domain-containing protein [Candidatus Andersenbacteria bacterium]|nr:MazG nucleotide pyrophosphohydrolase domain-containing protein [bacterium]MDZ4225524.1 MazG nucleotide pyrophosphohydrolase domain-containing protein [Candidatus Andersenbacteria bacterium]